MRTNTKLLLASAISMTITACGGGGGGGGGGGTPGSSSGLAVDGYLINSRVVCDTNGNSVEDAGEAFTLTDNTGRFTFTPACAAQLIVTGGENEVKPGTRFPFKGKLKAKAGGKVVSPISTIFAESTLTEAELVAMLGLPVGTDILNADPTTNIAVYKANVALAKLIDEMADAFGATPGDTSIYAVIAKSIADTLAANPGQQLFSPTGTINAVLLQDAIEEANTDLQTAGPGGSPIGNTLDATQVSDFTTGVVTATEKLLDPTITTPDDLEDVAEDELDPEQPAIIPPTDYLSLNNDAFYVNGVSIPFSTFKGAGASSSGLDTLGFDFEIHGTPDIDNKTVSVYLSLTETGKTNNRVVQLQLDKVTMHYTNGELSATVPATAKVYVYGKTTGNKEINLALTNVAENILDADPTTNKLTLNYSNIVQRILNSGKVDEYKTEAEELLNVNGAFDVKFLANSLNIRYSANDGKNPLETLEGSVTNAVDASTNKAVPGISGYGITGKLTVN